MKSLDSSLLVLEIASVAFGYRALNELTTSSNVRIIEASPIGARFLITALGETTELAAALKRVRVLIDGGETALLVDSELIDNCEPSVRDAVYSLSEAQLEESLVVVECETVSACMSAAQALVKGHGLRVIEIRVQRSSTSGAYGFFTGAAQASAAGAEDVRAKLKAMVRKGRVEVVAAPSSELRRFFACSGES